MLTRRSTLVSLLSIVGLLAGLAATAPIAPTAAAATSVGAAATAGPKRPAVVGVRTIGRSVQGRKILAWRVGNPKAKRKVVVMSTMHGNERDTVKILWALRDGRPITGVDMWLVPLVNPDGYRHNTRKNARGVDLNRNFRHNWRDLDGRYESGRRPASEPETKAVVRFLKNVRPHRIVSFHQPLHGVDTDTKRPGFARRLARHLNLPRDRFDCGGACYGTMTSWYNARFAGAAVTVEYGHHPSKRRMKRYAPVQLLRVFGAKRVRR